MKKFHLNIYTPELKIYATLVSMNSNALDTAHLHLVNNSAVTLCRNMDKSYCCCLQCNHCKWTMVVQVKMFIDCVLRNAVLKFMQTRLRLQLLE